MNTLTRGLTIVLGSMFISTGLACSKQEAGISHQQIAVEESQGLESIDYFFENLNDKIAKQQRPES